MEQLLTYEQILQSLIDFSQHHEEDEISQNEAYKILNQMNQSNGHQEFNYDIAVELFDRILSSNNPIRINLLAMVITEANDIIITKYNHSMNREMYIQEQKAYLKSMIAYGSETYLQIQNIKILDQNVQRPYIVIHIGEFLHESEVGTIRNAWFEWILNVRIPVKSLIPDLKIELLENNQIVANLQIPCEALPVNEIKEAELMMENQNHNTKIFLSCQLMIGSNVKELIEEKMAALNSQSGQCQEELFMLQSQLNELCKPFVRELKMQPKQTKFTTQSFRSNLNSYEIFANIPNKNSLLPSLQATAFKNTSSALGFKQKIVEPQPIRSFPFMARIDLLATLIALLSMIVNCFTPDLISFTCLMIIVMAIMLKHKQFLIYLITLVIVGLAVDICSLNYLSVFAILCSVLNMLLKIILLILTGMLMDNPENMQVLKTKLLLL